LRLENSSGDVGVGAVPEHALRLENSFAEVAAGSGLEPTQEVLTDTTEAITSTTDETAEEFTVDETIKAVTDTTNEVTEESLVVDTTQEVLTDTTEAASPGDRIAPETPARRPSALPQSLRRSARLNLNPRSNSD
jgi:prophage DNA circulation protein